jgi:hypothetical protein
VLPGDVRIGALRYQGLDDCCAHVGANQSIKKTGAACAEWQRPSDR